MPTEQTKSQSVQKPPATARFLEVRAGRLRVEETRSGYSSRLALSRRTVGPTD